MDDNPSADANKKEPVNKVPPSPPRVIPDISSIIYDYPASNKKQKWYQKRPDWSHIFQGVGIAVGLGVAWIYWGQLDEMINQTWLLNEQAGRSVIEDIGNATTARQQLGLLQNQVVSAQESVRTIQKQFQLQQRPIIAITTLQLISIDGKAIPQPVRGQPVAVNIFFKNVGLSVALNVHPHYHMLFASESSKIKIEPLKKNDWLGDDIPPTPPNTQGSFATAISTKDTFSREDVKFNESDLVGWDGTPVVVFGKILYRDQFGNRYCLPYMSQLLPTGTWAAMINLEHVSTKDLCPKGEPK
jgi:hypothetical protein